MTVLQAEAAYEEALRRRNEQHRYIAAARREAASRAAIVPDIEIEIAPYGFMVRPHWVDLVTKRLKEVLRLRVTRLVEQRRIKLLEEAVVKVTQRVNLFDKVTIPRAKANIRRINIALGDLERAAVVNSKISKSNKGSS